MRRAPGFFVVSSLVAGLSAGVSCGGQPFAGPVTIPTGAANTLGNEDHILNKPPASAVSSAIAIVTAPEFKAQLARYKELQTRVSGSAIDGADLVERYLHPADDSIPLPTQYTTVTRSCRRQTASTGVRIEVTGETTSGPTTTAIAETTLDACTVDRMNAKETEYPARFACAINTLAHEWTHSVVDAKGIQIFQDDGHLSASAGLVSYTVGAVAQCIQLNKYYFVYSSETGDSIDACVQVVGNTYFNPDTCDDDWAAHTFGRRINAQGDGDGKRRTLR